ncbi:MAG: 2-C-methyl-D-erythritol 2,4-cyclodiphosphate synthase [Bacteroidetes bacterium]|nr:2-C-methyl-D-erythritol 2,4-cyclodiphosphate synthase [Bacteroidota bacterium]
MIRIGFGYDVHRFADGHPLVLGGIRIPSERGLLGHSDADVLLHAICDALLGALALGDIGMHFPDTDPAWKDADSAKLLAGVVSIVAEKGFYVVNVDSTVVLERPRLRAHVDAMRGRIAEILGIDSSQVSVKATTSEGMGFVGTGEGAAAYATCLVASDSIGVSR